MMKKFISAHKKRVVKIKSYTNKNKLFVIIAVILAAYLVISNVINTDKNTGDNKQIEEKTEYKPTWKFYVSDLAILLIGGSICTVMIIKERKKAKENL